MPCSRIRYEKSGSATADLCASTLDRFSHVVNRTHRSAALGKRVALIAGWLMLTACATQGTRQERIAGPALQIAGVEIYNGLPYSVHDVSILATSSGDFVSCGQILPDTSCSTTFPVRDYREDPVQVSWTEQGEPHSTKPFKLSPPANAKAGQEAYIRVEVFASGQAGAKLLVLNTESP